MCNKCCSCYYKSRLVVLSTAKFDISPACFALGLKSIYSLSRCASQSGLTELKLFWFQEQQSMTKR